MINSKELLKETENGLTNIKKIKPLTQCITNIVTSNDCANAVLTVGGSPMMADDAEEEEEVVGINNALEINIGKLSKDQREAMFVACKKANEENIPITLDPVGVGISTLRNEVVLKIINNYELASIRGNMSEIKTIARLIGIINEETIAKGVDVADDDIISKDNLKRNGKIVKDLANQLNTIVFASGPIDIISDGENTYTIENGSDMMPRITGSGCMLSAVVAAFIGSNKPLIGVITAGLTTAIAGEIAGEYCKENNLGTGNFRAYFIDELYKMNYETIKKMAKFNSLEI
ncbi:hydroxyethylthiazole kinase [Methanobrevibacter sp. 87.7]|uniref:hydroxyethylthiazole kinase n=1 Tax=Methanobrevibacter sp. 87.7 TaxID=387957 RepID=UPI000B50910D|nr:hydroxyethylthiazole kinase [Methanobrevibacter sp. 87.7]OWT33876.1 hydroxyethylthiazole kinase [Methanobrevibacter sp. 87.7]